jgi:hypothetical protein
MRRTFPVALALAHSWSSVVRAVQLAGRHKLAPHRSGRVRRTHRRYRGCRTARENYELALGLPLVSHGADNALDRREPSARS